jgi:DNA-binding GntR family transcriptional regulator
VGFLDTFFVHKLQDIAGERIDRDGMANASRRSMTTKVDPQNIEFVIEVGTNLIPATQVRPDTVNEHERLATPMSLVVDRPIYRRRHKFLPITFRLWKLRLAGGIPTDSIPVKRNFFPFGSGQGKNPINISATEFGGKMNSSNKLEVPETLTLRDKTVEVLRDAILTQYFKPGQQLVERTLADETGVSRTSIRSALGQLEAEGLVVRAPGKGMFVTQVTAEEAKQIYEMRGVIESSMARFFVERASDENIAAVESAIAAAEEVTQPENSLLYAHRLDAVSDAIMSGAGNDVARQMAAVLRARITFLRTITARSAPRERRKATFDMLYKILEAFKERDAATAESLTRQYIQRSAEFAQQVLRDPNQNSL